MPVDFLELKYHKIECQLYYPHGVLSGNNFGGRENTWI